MTERTMKQSYFLLVAIAIVALFSASVSAQLKNFTWEEELCSYRGLYDPKKYTEAELRNTLKLINRNDFNLIEHSTSVFGLSDIARINVAAFDAKYRDMAQRLRELRIVRTPYFQGLRAAKLKELEHYWQMSRTSMIAFSDPSAINDFKLSPSCNQRFAGPLMKGGDDLMAAWLSVNMDNRSKNSDPERLRREFERQKASSDADTYARIEVITFGWYNCANQDIEYVGNDGSAGEEFQKLLTRVRGQCDEP